MVRSILAVSLWAVAGSVGTSVDPQFLPIEASGLATRRTVIADGAREWCPSQCDECTLFSKVLTNGMYRNDHRLPQGTCVSGGCEWCEPDQDAAALVGLINALLERGATDLAAAELLRSGAAVWFNDDRLAVQVAGCEPTRVAAQIRLDSREYDDLRSATLGIAIADVRGWPRVRVHERAFTLRSALASDFASAQ
jgi:hypothetical protein